MAFKSSLSVFKVPVSTDECKPRDYSKVNEDFFRLGEVPVSIFTCTKLVSFTNALVANAFDKFFSRICEFVCYLKICSIL